MTSSEVTPFSYANSKGKTYYLHYLKVKLKNSKHKRTIYYFSPALSFKKSLAYLPAAHGIIETRTGLPMLTKKVEVSKTVFPS